MKLIEDNYESDIIKKAKVYGLAMSRTEEMALVNSGVHLNDNALDAVFAYEVKKCEILREERKRRQELMERRYQDSRDK